MVTLETIAVLCALAGSGDTVLLHFSADWCGPCRAMEPTVRRLEADGYPVRHVNFDAEPQTAAQYGVRSVPTFILVSAGRQLDRVEGATSHSRLVRMYQQAGIRQTAPRASQTMSPGRLAPVSNSGPVSNSPVRSGVMPAAFTAPVRREASVAAVPAQHIPNRHPGFHAQPQKPIASAAMPRSPAQRALNATVRLTIHDASGHSFGTGTIIDAHHEESLIVTCGHIFRSSEGKGRIVVDLFGCENSPSVEGTLISCDLEKDVAMVSIKPPCVVDPVPVAGVEYRPREQVRVFSVGCDQGRPPSVRNSFITGVNRVIGPPNIEVAGAPVNGRSGGGLFTEDGQLIGICNLASPQDNEGIYASLPLVHQQLDHIGQQRIYLSEDRQIATAASSATPPAANALLPQPETKLAWEQPMAQPAAIPTINKPLPSAPLPPPPLAAVPTSASGGARATSVSAPTENVTEIICVIRTESDPQGQSRVVVLDRPSQQLIEQIARESRSPQVVRGQAPASGM